MNREIKTGMARSCVMILAALCGLLSLCVGSVRAQGTPESETATIKLGRLWVGVAANCYKATFDYFSGFFPNDYDIIGNRGQYAEAFGGAGFTLTASDWRDPIDTLHNVAVYGPVNNFMPNGKVIAPLKNYIRYRFPQQTVDNRPVPLTYPGTYDPSKFAGHSYDQLIEVMNEHIFKVQIQRRIMAWSQNFNDDYVMVDVEFSNVGTDTLKSFYVHMFEGNGNMQFSSMRNPYPAAGEAPNLVSTWMHYYGGRVRDTMRVFYEYSADNPDAAGDNMGAPAVSQGGRLTYGNLTYYAILHASREPYVNPADDVDDFLQPKVTFIGNGGTRMPYNPQEDEYGDKNFWAIRGSFSDYFPMDTINAWPGTHHGGNNDELGVTDFSSYPSGTKQGNDQKRYSSFGPYTFPPGTKIHIVYASGYAGIGLKAAREVGEKWLKGTLEDAPNLPDPEKGWLPKNFAFPIGATEMDKRKARWISTGIDSVMHSAWRAKWNHDHDYDIPQAPPPPDNLTITGHGDGVEIKWTDQAAEAMSGFAGYRIMRRVGNRDTVYYNEVYNSDGSDRRDEHIFKDTSIVYGAQYYYYVQAKAKIDENDLSADPTTRGQIICSSRLLVPDVTKINPPRPPQDDLSRIRIVPNPYNINDPLIPGSYGWTDERGVQFFNLPPAVTIRIFTENGDLIRTIVHNPPIKTGYEFWDMITSSQQVISSGVYVVVFEKPTGELSYQKLVVVR